MSAMNLVTSLWSSFGLLSIAPEPWGVTDGLCCAPTRVDGAAS